MLILLLLLEEKPGQGKGTSLFPCMFFQINKYLQKSYIQTSRDENSQGIEFILHFIGTIYCRWVSLNQTILWTNI